MFMNVYEQLVAYLFSCPYEKEYKGNVYKFMFMNVYEQLVAYLFSCPFCSLVPMKKNIKATWTYLCL